MVHILKENIRTSYTCHTPRRQNLALIHLSHRRHGKRQKVQATRTTLSTDTASPRRRGILGDKPSWFSVEQGSVCTSMHVFFIEVDMRGRHLGFLGPLCIYEDWKELMATVDSREVVILG